MRCGHSRWRSMVALFKVCSWTIHLSTVPETLHPEPRFLAQNVRWVHRPLCPSFQPSGSKSHSVT
jgi:hypothetical protein